MRNPGPSPYSESGSTGIEFGSPRSQVSALIIIGRALGGYKFISTDINWYLCNCRALPGTAMAKGAEHGLLLPGASTSRWQLLWPGCIAPSLAQGTRLMGSCPWSHSSVQEVCTPPDRRRRELYGRRGGGNINSCT